MHHNHHHNHHHDYHHEQVQGEQGKMLDAQYIVKQLIEPEKTNLGFVFNELLPNEQFLEHNALEDARATYRVYEEVKFLSALDDTGMTKLCPNFDPPRDQVGEKCVEKDHPDESLQFSGDEEHVQRIGANGRTDVKDWLAGCGH